MIINVQIPKCASMSTKYILTSHFGGSWSGVVGNTAEQAYNLYSNEIERRKKTKQNRPIKAISGHMPFGIHKYIDEPCVYIMVSRHPIERVLSLWRFTYGRHSSHNLPLTDWLDVAGTKAHNVVTRYMGGEVVDHSWAGESSFFQQVPFVKIDEELSLLKAKSNVDKCHLIGVVERFEKFQRELESYLGLKKKDIFHKNQFHYTPLEAKIEGYQPTNNEIDKILKLNEMDLELHNYISKVAP